MTEHPINLKSWEVRAVLDGRTTMTRRVLKPQPVMRGEDDCVITYARGGHTYSGPPDFLIREILPKYGLRWRPGDHLWVRERFSGEWPYNNIPPREWDRGEPIWYWADGNPDDGDWTKPKLSTQMPRWASRITLLVTDVRVERLQDISEADACAEGAFKGSATGRVFDSVASMRAFGPQWRNARDWFADTWDSIHGPDAWGRNDWVSVTKFERVT